MWYAQLHDSQEWLLSPEVEMMLNTPAKCRAWTAASQMTDYFALRWEHPLDELGEYIKRVFSLRIHMKQQTPQL